MFLFSVCLSVCLSIFHRDRSPTPRAAEEMRRQCVGEQHLSAAHGASPPRVRGVRRPRERDEVSAVRDPRARSEIVREATEAFVRRRKNSSARWDRGRGFREGASARVAHAETTAEGGANGLQAGSAIQAGSVILILVALVALVVLVALVILVALVSGGGFRAAVVSAPEEHHRGGGLRDATVRVEEVPEATHGGEGGDEAQAVAQALRRLEDAREVVVGDDGRDGRTAAGRGGRHAAREASHRPRRGEACGRWDIRANLKGRGGSGVRREDDGGDARGGGGVAGRARRDEPEFASPRASARGM